MNLLPAHPRASLRARGRCPVRCQAVAATSSTALCWPWRRGLPVRLPEKVESIASPTAARCADEIRHGRRRPSRRSTASWRRVSAAGTANGSNSVDVLLISTSIKSLPEFSLRVSPANQRDHVPSWACAIAQRCPDPRPHCCPIADIVVSTFVDRHDAPGGVDLYSGLACPPSGRRAVRAARCATLPGRRISRKCRHQSRFSGRKGYHCLYHQDQRRRAMGAQLTLCPRPSALDGGPGGLILLAIGHYRGRRPSRAPPRHRPLNALPSARRTRLDTAPKGAELRLVAQRARSEG